MTKKWHEEEAARHDVDADLLLAMAYLYSVREEVLTHHATRVGVEAWFVEQGWGNARIRGLMRSLERVPNDPKSIEEKLVSDADTVCCLGLLGFSRAMIGGGSLGLSMDEIIEQTRQTLYRRGYTAPGQAEIIPRKSKLRDLLEALRLDLEASEGS
ncbi:MAG: hypothetical protein AAF735_02350 [Myxococcota bacterium]